MCLKIYKNFGEIINIIELDNFTYGRVLNLGLLESTNKWVLSMSFKSIPLGKFFFNEVESLIIDSKFHIDGIEGLSLKVSYKKALDFFRFI
jgi:hypothetical protein